jgi:hypothetical protein
VKGIIATTVPDFSMPDLTDQHLALRQQPYKWHMNKVLLQLLLMLLLMTRGLCMILKSHTDRELGPGIFCWNSDAKKTFVLK